MDRLHAVLFLPIKRASERTGEKILETGIERAAAFCHPPISKQASREIDRSGVDATPLP